ncbi:T-complex protein 1 subunit alpha [Pancytospora epiphaga]|nr:T-complex protein 1 subunit alpha [Pancytospora epiphaga]
MASEISTNTLLTGCEAFRGVNAVNKNAMAVKQIYDSIRTSYGPLGLDKMCIDASGTVSITNDGATILSNMIVEDPSAKLLVNLALEQDRTVGDGTTSVVLLAANLIMLGAKLVEDGIHPSTVVSGYRMALNECIGYIRAHVAKKLEEGAMADAVVETSISSKIISVEKELFIKIVKQALDHVLQGGKYMVERINILKAPGESLRDSEFYNGYILNCSVASRLMLNSIKNPKIACIDFSLLREKLPLTVNIRVTDPEKIEAIRMKEIEMTKNKCRAIIESGANLVLTTGGIDEMCVKMFIDAGVVAVRRCSRVDLLTIAKAVGTQLKESIVGDDSMYKLDGLGTCDSYEIKDIGDHNLVFLSGCRDGLASILLRGPNSQILDEAERSVNDALQILKRTLESKSVVPGGGAVEAALSFMLEEFVTQTNCREHIAIHRYSEALLEIPRILASNAALDSNKILGELLSKQYKVFKSGVFDRFYGLDVTKGEVQDNLKAGIVEPTMYKLRALRAATEAAISVLRINEINIFPGK